MAGYGAGSILAYYTSASDKNGQIQCLAYSKDNGRTFTKYEKNPVLRPSDGLKDFRDPKVFWYAPESKWVMIVSADKEMRFYDSHNLKDWNYLSSFGEGYGVQPCQFECPDMVELPVDGDINYKKWALIVNVNPGCYFGGVLLNILSVTLTAQNLFVIISRMSQNGWTGGKITMLLSVSQIRETVWWQCLG